MSTNNNAPFYVGQKVICVEPDDNNLLKKDKEYKILWTGNCGCGAPTVRVGIKSPFEYDYHICGHVTISNGDKIFNARRFRPINPYSTSATQELIKSVVIGDTTDQPVKEIINS
jgi:hypothetical protein